MAISLKSTETVKATATFHWSIFVALAVWAVFITPGFIATITVGRASAGLTVFFALLAYLPLVIRILQNQGRHFVVTNERLFVEQGFFAKSKKDVPLQKINDLEVTQGLLDRIFGCGNIRVLTGNDKPTILKNLANPEAFKDALSEAVSALTKKTG